MTDDERALELAIEGTLAVKRTLDDIPINEGCLSCRKMRNLCKQILSHAELLAPALRAEKQRAELALEALESLAGRVDESLVALTALQANGLALEEALQTNQPAQQANTNQADDQPAAQ